MISVIWKSDSVIAGRISAFRPLLVRSPVVHQPSATVSPRPNDGSQPRSTAKTRISRMPIRNVGRLTPTSEAASSRCESHVSRLQRRVDAERDADDEREQRGGNRQLERGRQALLEQRRHRTSLPQRPPEIAVRRVADEARELHGERLVEAELGAKPRLLLERRVLADHERDRVAGEVEQTERDERHDRHHGERLQDAAKDEGDQGGR